MPGSGRSSGPGSLKPQSIVRTHVWFLIPSPGGPQGPWSHRGGVGRLHVVAEYQVHCFLILLTLQLGQPGSFPSFIPQCPLRLCLGSSFLWVNARHQCLQNRSARLPPWIPRAAHLLGSVELCCLLTSHSAWFQRHLLFGPDQVLTSAVVITQCDKESRVPARWTWPRYWLQPAPNSLLDPRGGCFPRVVLRSELKCTKPLVWCLACVSYC